MHVRIRDGEVEDVELRIYEPPRFFEAFLRGPASHRGARHHRADLRHLPGRLPDERLRGDRGRVRRRRSTSRSATLRRLIYCGEWIESHALHVFMLHAPDFLGYESAVEMARDHREVVERGLRIKKAGNELIRVDRRPRDPPDQRARRRLLPRAAPARAAGARRAAGAGARARARDRRAGPRRSPSPTSSRTTSSSRSPTPDGLPDRAGPARLERRPRHRARRVRGALRRGARARTRPRCTRGCASAAPTSSGRWRATRSTRTALAARPRGGARGRARRRSAATRSRASSSAASRSSTRSTRRCG